MSDPTTTTITPLRLYLRMIFIFLTIVTLTLPYGPYLFNLKTPPAEGIQKIILAVSPAALAPLSIVFHKWASPSWQSNYHLHMGLFAFFFGALNSANYLGIIHYISSIATSTWAALGAEAIIFPAIVFLISWFIFSAIIWACHGWENLGIYGVFHNDLKAVFWTMLEMGRGAVETAVGGLKGGLTGGLTSLGDLFRVCWRCGVSTPDASESDLLAVPPEASLPPPYWMNMPFIQPTTASSSSDVKHQVLGLELD